LVHATDELPDFLTMQQQFPGATRIVVEKLGGGLVRRNVDVVEMNFAVPNQGEPVPQVGFAFPDGFHFGPHEGDARFVGFQNFVLKSRLTATILKPSPAGGAFFVVLFFVFMRLF
jgi:hypothetical protein